MCDKDTQVSTDSVTFHHKFLLCTLSHPHTLTPSHPHTSRHQDEREGKWKVSDVVLIYSLNEQEFELFNEYQFMYPSNQETLYSNH